MPECFQKSLLFIHFMLYDTSETKLSFSTMTIYVLKNLKMQHDIDIEPIIRFPGMVSIDKQMDESESKVRNTWDGNV